MTTVNFGRDKSVPTVGRYSPDRVVGYADPISARPGESIRLMVNAPSRRFSLSFIRYRGHPDMGDAPEAVASPIDGEHEGRTHDLVVGSYLVVGGMPSLGSFGLKLDYFPTLLDDIQRGLLVWSGSGMPGLLVSDRGLVLRLVDSGGGVHELQSDGPLATGVWHAIEVVYDEITGEAMIRVVSALRYDPSAAAAETRALLPPGLGLPAADLHLGASWKDGHPADHVNGRIAAPSVEALGVGVVAAWDFAADHANPVIPDTSGYRRHATVHGQPTRSVPGPRWTGREIDPRLEPALFDAIHFHEDSFDGADWPATAVLVVPEDWRSGVYAAVVSDGESSDEIPIYVRPANGAEHPVLFLAPTNTYTAYANELHPETLARLMKDEENPHHPNQYYLSQHPEFGPSAYDIYRDGYGSPYSSRLRPILNWRAGYRDWFTGTYRHFGADLFLIGLLERKGVAYDVATDEDLDAEGTAMLASHLVVLTGSHPEYATAGMLDSIETYLNQGGRWMYLGANGYYWVTSYRRGARDMLEVRRVPCGNTSYYLPPGYGVHSTTGEPGGLWRNRGRAPNAIVGVGFSAKGWARARPYTRVLPDGDDRWGWVFDGIPFDAPIGVGGAILDGAAGDELDRFDIGLGCPRHASILATACGFSKKFQPAIEEYTSWVPGQDANPDVVRADIVAFETPLNGGVFSVGSMTWIGALTANNYDNAVSTVTMNVLTRFSSMASVTGS